MGFLFIALTIAFTVAGQLMVKYGMMRVGSFPAPASVPAATLPAAVVSRNSRRVIMCAPRSRVTRRESRS